MNQYACNIKNDTGIKKRKIIGPTKEKITFFQDFITFSERLNLKNKFIELHDE